MTREQLRAAIESEVGRACGRVRLDLWHAEFRPVDDATDAILAIIDRWDNGEVTDEEAACDQ